VIPHIVEISMYFLVDADDEVEAEMLGWDVVQQITPIANRYEQNEEMSNPAFYVHADQI
jgi:hypothetical protein